MQTHYTIDPFFRRLFLVAIMVIGLYLLYLMMPVIMPFLCAFILAYLFNPLVKRIALIMPRWLAIMVVYVGITVGVVLLVWWLAPMLWNQMQMAWNYLPVAQEWYNGQVRDVIQHYTRIRLPAMESKRLSETLVDYMRNNYNVQDAQALFQQVLVSGMNFINNAGLIVLMPILMFYFLLNWNERLLQWQQALPKVYRAKIIEIFIDMDKALMSFVQGQLVVMILLGVIYAVADLLGSWFNHWYGFWIGKFCALFGVWDWFCGSHHCRLVSIWVGLAAFGVDCGGVFGGAGGGRLCATAVITW